MEGKLKKSKEGGFSLSHEPSGWWIGDTDHDKVKQHRGEQMLSKLSLKNCQAIELGYDLDELFQREIDELMFSGNLEDAADYRSGMYKGAKILLEILGDKKFSEHSLREAIAESWNSCEDNEGETFTQVFNRILKSLKQTEWEVEIVMEEPLVAKSRQIHGEYVASKIIESTMFPKPLLDADGCLILKRK